MKDSIQQLSLAPGFGCYRTSETTNIGFAPSSHVGKQPPRLSEVSFTEVLNFCAIRFQWKANVCLEVFSILLPLSFISPFFFYPLFSFSSFHVFPISQCISTRLSLEELTSYFETGGRGYSHVPFCQRVLRFVKLNPSCIFSLQRYSNRRRVKLS